MVNSEATSLVGGEHEFLDHLMALVVIGQMGAGRPPPDLGQLDLHLGHRQFQGNPA